MIEEYAYRYTDMNGQPLEKCPQCDHSLQGEDGIYLELTSGSAFWQEMTCLDKEGRLVDPHDQIAQGLHSATCCGGCYQMLISMEECIEVPK